jgi:16S rRNA processing protein RimM
MGRRVAVGRIVRPHGIRGEVVVHRFGDGPGMLDPGARLGFGETGVELVVSASRPHGGNWIVGFDGVNDRNRAETLTGATLTVEAEALPPLPEGTYYSFQLIGLRVRTGEGTLLGTLEEILETGAQDVYVVRGEGRELLLPALREVVTTVDLDRGEMTVVIPPGLIEAEAPPPGSKGSPRGRGAGGDAGEERG